MRGTQRREVLLPLGQETGAPDLLRGTQSHRTPQAPPGVHSPQGPMKASELLHPKSENQCFLFFIFTPPIGILETALLGLPADSFWSCFLGRKIIDQMILKSSHLPGTRKGLSASCLGPESSPGIRGYAGPHLRAAWVWKVPCASVLHTCRLMVALFLGKKTAETLSHKKKKVQWRWMLS